MLTPYEIFFLFGLPAATFSWYHILRHAGHYVQSGLKIPPGLPPKIIFSIAARSLTPILKIPVDSIKSACSESGFSNYEIKLVVDKIETNIEGVDTILVPRDFVCLSKFKARALHYALSQFPNSKEVWILHLDEDARVTPQCVTSILNYIHNRGNPIANGPSVFPYDGNVLTFYAEAQRLWTFYWLKDQEVSGRIHWLNGSNLLIRSDIEQAVGWSFVNCFISEDARFGYEATKKFGKIFGWHGGLTIETPPATLGGILKQRTRWFYGSILNLRYVPRARLPRRIYSVTAWWDGLVLTLFLFFMLASLGSGLRFFSSHYFIYVVWGTAVFWLGRYQIGVYQNLKFSSLSRTKKFLLHLGIIPLAPIIDLICSLPTVLAFIKRPTTFEITAKRKSGTEEEGSA
jgi:egghead protein (zeste-white 4 protein)